ncbi:MAG: acylglycerol kinase family protein, partial [bacterium]|nr:acylglycerol kinase family protein [bacterium]
MKPKSKKQSKRSHFCLLVNKAAASYDPSLIEKCTRLIKSKGHNYTVVEPKSGVEMARLAEIAAGVRKSHRFYTPAVSRRGKVTALIAAGGDGTVNLVARAAEQAKLPVGIIPMGKDNNIARSLFGEDFDE